MTLEEYRAHKEHILRTTLESDARRAAAGASSGGFASGAQAASEARDLVANLREHANAINGIAAHLDPRNLKQLATLFGQEWADDYRARLEAGRASATELLGVTQQQIAERFTVQGNLVQRGEDGSFALGAFALEAQGEGCAVRIGSNGAAGTPPADPGPPGAEPPPPRLPLDMRT